jgi:2-polyprenyl-3-methyl-5-hydroxy-6-metoxy-1,4-benzoquinol methylase
VKTREITCNACGADRFRPISVAGDWTIGSCGSCGLVYVNPAPFFDPTDEFSEMSLDFIYTQYMHQPITDSILAFERDQLAANAGELARLAEGKGEANGRVRFLDIGCGSGASVRAAADRGWEAMGIDIDPMLVRKGREELGVDLRCTLITECGLPPGQFDFIKLRDVIEHLPNPNEALLAITELLAPGGIALIVTPNEGGLATWGRSLLRRPRTLVATVPPPHHLHSFDPGTLAMTMRRGGLAPLQTFTTTPTDGRYVTSHNMGRAQSHPILRPVWRVGQAIGRGAVLVSWAARQ